MMRGNCDAPTDEKRHFAIMMILSALAAVRLNYKGNRVSAIAICINEEILSLFGITVSSFVIAGGILLFIVSIELLTMVLGDLVELFLMNEAWFHWHFPRYQAWAPSLLSIVLSDCGIGRNYAINCNCDWNTYFVFYFASPSTEYLEGVVR